MAIETVVGPETLTESLGGGGAVGSNTFTLDHPADEVTIFCKRIDGAPSDEWQVELQASLDLLEWTETVSPVRAFRMPVTQTDKSFTIKGVIHGRIRIVNAEGSGGDVLSVEVSWVKKKL